MSEQLLRLDHITMQFGGVVAVDDLELEVNEGEIVALIGPNGAGKTTAFNVITGVYQPTNGAVWFDGAKIIENHPQGKMKKQYKGQCDGLFTETLSPTPDKITRAGMARTFQNIRLWKTQTVFDNVLIAKHCRSTSSVFSAAFRLNRKEEAAQRAQVEELLEIVGLSDVKNELATSLPYGKQRRLEIARALAAEPKLLLLDEPAAGMNPQETEELTAFIGEIREKFKITILLIEHHMNLVMGISDRIYVLDFGKLIAHGTPAEIQKNQRVIDAYLGWRTMLKIENLQVHYGGIQALRGISLEVPDGRIVTLIGANGAGKSTTLRTITGLVKASGGSVQWDGQELLGKSIDKIISTGIAMSPEGRRVFPDMTVLENLKIGAYLRRDKAEIDKDIQWVYSLFPRLEERSWQLAGTLSGGEQQMLAVGRALMSRPKLMMLDEPSLGLAPLVVQDIFSIIREINRQGVTVLLVEQNANMALKIADLAYVLETGTITMSGTGAELLADSRVKEAYLGKSS